MSVFMPSILALALCLTLGADSGSARNPDYAQAVKLVEAGDHAGAIALLRTSAAADSRRSRL